VSETTLLVALLAGVASFLSPCMLPVIPAFLAQLAGTSLALDELRRRDILLSVALFVAGFSVVFSVLGVVLSAALAEVATEAITWLSRMAGTVVILLGLHLSGLLRLPFLDREWRMGSFSPGRFSPGRFTPLVFGASFAVAWTPCVGPILGGTLVLAASQPASALPLLLAYSVGLGMPFLLVGLFPARAFGFIKRHRRFAARMHAAFGFVLIAMGVLVFTNKLSLLANFPMIKEVIL